MASKLRITIHESSVSDVEIMEYCGKIPADYSYVSSLPFNDENISIVNEKNGHQIDSIKARVRMGNVFPAQHQDYAIYGILEYKKVNSLAPTRPDTQFYLVIAIGESVDDYPPSEHKNVKYATWSYIRDHLYDKLGIKKKEPKVEKESKRKNTSVAVKQGRTDKHEIARRSRPTEPRESDEWPDPDSLQQEED